MVIEDSGIGCKAAISAGLQVIVTVSAYTGSDDFTGASLVTSNLEDGPVSLATIEALITGKN
jgi:beta-phosphoglucomutase-like phosphatase (HAD superfamily)